jgi:hypothetical protein
VYPQVKVSISHRGDDRWLILPRLGMLDLVENQSERRETRQHEIGDRIAAIRTRINDLQQPRESRLPAEAGDLLVEARQHAAESKATAQQALASSINGFLRAAQAHERCAISHERLAAAPDSNEEEHRQQAARHRAAAAADRRRAERAQSLLASRTADSQAVE